MSSYCWNGKCELCGQEGPMTMDFFDTWTERCFPSCPEQDEQSEYRKEDDILEEERLPPDYSCFFR